MAISMCTRFANVQNILNINKFSAVGSALNVIQHLDITSRTYAMGKNEANILLNDDNKNQEPSKNISKAMKMYIKRNKEYKDLLIQEEKNYNLGKRHLANMMGKDPDEFTRRDINNAVKYLFPSGLYDRKARPVMLEPHKIHEAEKSAQFNENGRPYHFLFYTCKPNYYETLHNIADALYQLNNLEVVADESFINKFDTTGSEWLSKLNLEHLLLEHINTSEYEYLMKCLDKLIDHDMSKYSYEFIMKYRKKINNTSSNKKLPDFEYDEDGRPFITVTKCKRKTAVATVVVKGNGSGKIAINGKDILYFTDVQSREQVIFPLIFTNMADKVDIEATVTNGGPTGQSGAIRWGIAWGLRNFVDQDMMEKMRIAGLLTKDLRRRERKKPGREGARRRFTWKKR